MASTNSFSGGINPVRFTLNVLALLIWAGLSFGIWYQWQLQPLATKQQTLKVDDLEYPTILACNAMATFNLASRSHCADEFGPWNAAGQNHANKAENKAQKCLPVGRIVFFEPGGPRYCLKYQAPDNWRVDQNGDMAILKASVELLGPNGEEHYLPSEGLTLFVLSTSDWERAVFRYNKQGGNGTDFLKLFNDITEASSIAVAAAQHHTNVVVHVNRWKNVGGSTSLRYHLTTSSRPIHPQLLLALNAGSYHLCTLRIMFASSEIEETVEYARFDWLKLFGLSAAIAAALDLFVRCICYFLRLLIRQLCRKRSEGIISMYLHDEVELEDVYT